MSSFSLALKLLVGATIAGSILSIPFFASKATTEVKKDEVSSEQSDTVAKGSETDTSSPSEGSGFSELSVSRESTVGREVSSGDNDGWSSGLSWF